MMPFPVNHDLHCHTVLSACCMDARMSTQAVITHAQVSGYDTLCITNHLWDEAVPDPSEWYSTQNIQHVSRLLPFPACDNMRILFGCETEYCGGNKLGLSNKNFDLFDFIVIPINHFHMKNFTCPEECDTTEKLAELFTSRLEEVIKLPLPWGKIGIAHLSSALTFKDGDFLGVFEQMSAQRLVPIFRFFAQMGTGIELNAVSLKNWEKHPLASLRLYQMAYDAGCKFYCCSDAHTVEQLDMIQTVLPEVVRVLGLTDQEIYRVPETKK